MSSSMTYCCWVLLTFAAAAAQNSWHDLAHAVAQVEASESPATGLIQTKVTAEKKMDQNSLPVRVVDTVRQVRQLAPLRNSLSCWNHGKPQKNGTLFAQHIPKTGMCSALVELHKLDLEVWSGEMCYSYRYKSPVFGQNFVLFREPRAHVQSLYEECKSSDDWLFHQRADELGTFDSYIRHWKRKHQHKASGGHQMYSESYGSCYRPVNFMSHLMTCQYEDQWTYAEQVDEDLAIANMHASDMIGLTGAFQESMCVVHEKLTGTLPEYCNCSDHEKWALFHSAEITHGVEKHSEADDLTEEQAEIVDFITRSDRKLYEAARQRFLKDARTVEKKHGTTIVCEGSPLLG
eukprot:TRINITY_DN4078_c0_g1_i1.p1 TRINITY_DN4078_c0_g1~~TRINITY_DN4078_c0_g1_i1.p1  ORF type:complete len:348 (+),score=51.93 TRINITY_DN4078_c0_g1_i1:51-1094(+)